MKKNPYLLFLACLSFSYLHASTPDEAAHHQMVEYLRLLPDTLYFNQDYTIDISTQRSSHLSIAMAGYSVVQTDKSIHISVPWSNRESDNKLIRMYSGTGEAQSMIGEKPVVVVQKLKGNVASDNDLFKLDENVIGLSTNFSIAQMADFQKFDVNQERMGPGDVHVTSFTLTDAATGEKITNAGNTISNTTKAFITHFRTGEKVQIGEIKCSYQQNGMPANINLNYTINLTLAPNM